MRMSTTRKMLIGIICLVLFESAVLVSYFLFNVNAQVVGHIEQSMREVLFSNARMLDMIMFDFVDRAERMCVDENMYDLVRQLHRSNLSGIPSWQERMRKNVFSFFGSMANNYEMYIRDINIFSPDFNYSDRNLFHYDYEEFIHSQLWQEELEVGPYYYWNPTGDARDQLSKRMKSYIAGTDDKIDTVVFRLVKRMNISTVINDYLHKLPGEIPSPYLIISLDPALLNNTFAAGGLTDNSCYMIVSREGRIVSSIDPKQNGKVLEVPALIDAFASIQEYYSGSYLIDGEEAMVGVLPAQSCDWFYVCMVPQSDITQSKKNTIVVYIQLLLIVLSVTLLLGILFVWQNMRPIRELVQKAETIANAQQGMLTSTSSSETDRIMTVIDSMNGQIEHLIQSNVEVERREKDANILMLEMQINPHFLYNSLNKLHISLIQAGQDEIAERMLALARALRYSVDTREHMVYLGQDIEQLKLYLTVVQSAHENRFSVYYDIQEKLYDSIVPKMLLQPFVENSILHGFKDIAHGCLIHIEGAIQDNGDVIYSISDNGVGIPEGKKDMLTSGTDGHIGCSNVHKRIRMLFGENYGVSVVNVKRGTKILIRLPCIFDRKME